MLQEAGFQEIIFDNMTYIKLDNISFSYEHSEPVFRDFSLEINKGSCVMVEGDNGSGKTTLFRILAGLSVPSAGEYIFDGVRIDHDYLKDNKNSKHFHKRVGFLFQNPETMLFCARVYDEIAFGPGQMGMSDEETGKRVNELMGLFGLEAFAERPPLFLSWGQKKKVAFAAVMALNPEVILLDEPFAGMDEKNARWMKEFLAELKKAGKTLILASHGEELPDGFFDRTVRLHNTML